jgi:hypothetical protein
VARNPDDGADLDRDRPDRSAPVLDALPGTMGGNREGTGEHHPRDFLVFQFFRGLLLFAYACYRLDPVFMLGQATGLVIYSRNIYFIWLGKRASAPAKLV